VTNYAAVPVLPASYTWNDLEVIPVPYLRASVSAAAQLLSAPPAFLGYQQATTQSVPDATFTGISLDTEAWDSVNGHDGAANPSRYWNQFAGYYLAQFSCGVDYTGGAGIAAAAIGFSPENGSVTWYGGGCIPNGASSGHYATPQACKLLEMTSPGPLGGAGVDYALGGLYQSSGAAQDTWYDVAAGQYPQFGITWVSALAGTTGLAVPANPAWPVPPDYITSSFMNTNVTDAIAFLVYPPVMEATYTTGTATCASVTSLPTVGTTVPLNSATYDTWSAFSTSTHTWTAPVAGVYFCYGQSALTGVSTSESMAAGLTVTSSNYNGGTQTTLWQGVTDMNPGSSSVATVARRLRLNAGDTVLLAAAQRDSGSNAATLQAGEFASRLITLWRSA